MEGTLSYRIHREEINPEGFVRTLCGIDGGYQLDHIMSIKHGFDNNIDPRELSKKENLQMLPWKVNLIKGSM